MESRFDRTVQSFFVADAESVSLFSQPSIRVISQHHGGSHTRILAIAIQCVNVRTGTGWATSNGSDMTAQASDFVRFRETEYSLFSSHGSPLFEPQQAGLEPVALSTANYRGFVCGYAIQNGLRLVHLQIGQKPGVVPELFGHQAEPVYWMVGKWDETTEDYQRVPELMEDEWQFSKLDVPLDFTGGLVLCSDFRRDLDDGLGGQIPLHFYDTVLELRLQNGKVQEVVDQSQAVERYRHVETFPLVECFSLPYEDVLRFYSEPWT